MKEIKERNIYWNSGKWIDEVSIIGCSQVNTNKISVGPSSNLKSMYRPVCYECVFLPYLRIQCKHNQDLYIKLDHTSFHLRLSISFFINQFFLHRHTLKQA
jgi:hypothetical protein